MIKMFLCALILCSTLVPENSYSSQRIYNSARSMIGLVEGTRRANRIMGLNTSSVPWCGAFARKAVLRAGRKAPRHYLSARAWLRWGRRVSKKRARRGDILNIRTRYGWHVSVFSHRKRGRFCALGGNQRNRSKVSCYRSSSVRGVRR